MPHGQDAGFLGKNFDPFVLNADPSQPNFKVPDLLPPKDLGEARLERRRELRQVVDSTVKNFEASESAANNKENICCINLNEFLMWVLTAALRWN